MHGISFDDKHSFDDFNLILSEVDIPPANPKTTFVNIPGGNGSLDLTEAFGEVKYENRKCTFVFTIRVEDKPEEKKTEVNNFLNGRKCKIVLDKDSEYYFEGRCVVKKYSSDRNIHKLTIEATVAPYKLKNTTTKVTVQAGTNVDVRLVNGRKMAIPTITTTAETKIVFGTDIYVVNAGTHKILNLALKEGVTALTVTSEGITKFEYQEGDL